MTFLDRFASRVLCPLRSARLPLKVLIPIAYDYELSLRTLGLVYDHVDEIQIAVDIDRLTWSGKKFEVPSRYWDALKILDVDNKITVYEDSFFVDGQAPIVSDTRQRMRMSDKAGADGWHIQLDADEYFIDFERFVVFLRRLERHYGRQPLDVYVNFLSMFKRDDSGFFVSWPSKEAYPVATNRPNYRNVRSSHPSGRITLKADSYVLHDTWSRNESSLKIKLSSWGHLNDFDVEKYLMFWKSVSQYNYAYVRDFHPINPGLWSGLRFFKGDLNQVLASVSAMLDGSPESKLSGEQKYFLLPARVYLLLFMLKRFFRILSEKLSSAWLPG